MGAETREKPSPREAIVMGAGMIGFALLHHLGDAFSFTKGLDLSAAAAQEPVPLTFVVIVALGIGAAALTWGVLETFKP